MRPTCENESIIRETICDNLDILYGKKIYIFGCTIYASVIIEALLEKGIKIVGYLDNNKNKQGKMCGGYLVYDPASVVGINAEDCMIIVASIEYAGEMIRQLVYLGIAKGAILYIPIGPSNGEKNSVEDEFNNSIKVIEQGMQNYQKIIEVDTDEILLFPYHGTGDIYLACGFLKEYIESEQLKKVKLVVLSDKCKAITSMFGYGAITSVMTEYELRTMLCAWRFLGNTKIKIKPLLFWGWANKYYYHNYRGMKGITFLDLFKYDVFELDVNAQFQIPKFEVDKAYLKRLSIEKNLIEGKTVIISPYAGSFESSISIDTCEKIVCNLNNKGYIVCTNCYGDETAIRGSVAIQFPHNEAVSVVEYAGYFIGVRSGLCDIISSSNCKMLVIYESNRSSSNYDFFSLKKMGLKDDVIEIELENELELADRVQELFDEKNEDDANFF